MSLLPIIEITTNPAYPQCDKDIDFQMIQANCEIAQSNENYSVSWSKENIPYQTLNYNKCMCLSPLFIHSDKSSKYLWKWHACVILADSGSGSEVYSATTLFECNQQQPLPKIICIFTNRRNQSKQASIDVNIIKGMF